MLGEVAFSSLSVVGLRPRFCTTIVSRAIVFKCLRTRSIFMKPTNFCIRSQFLDIICGREALVLSMGRMVGGSP